MATLIEIATRISQNLDNPDSPTIGVIEYWLRHNIGNLNNLLNTGYSIDQTDGTVEPDLGENEAAIFQTMYLVKYYEGKIRANLGAAAIDSILEVSENGAVVRMTNKNSIAQTYSQIKNQEQEVLNKLVTFYRGNNATPQGIDGDDTVDVLFNGVNSVRSKTSNN